MEEKKKEPTERVIKEEIPPYLVDFLKDIANDRKPGEEFEAIRINVEWMLTDVLADKKSPMSEIKILYKNKEWMDKHRG